MSRKGVKTEQKQENKATSDGRPVDYTTAAATSQQPSQGLATAWPSAARPAVVAGDG